MAISPAIKCKCGVREWIAKGEEDALSIFCKGCGEQHRLNAMQTAEINKFLHDNGLPDRVKPYIDEDDDLPPLKNAGKIWSETISRLAHRKDPSGWTCKACSQSGKCPYEQFVDVIMRELDDMEAIPEWLEQNISRPDTGAENVEAEMWSMVAKAMMHVTAKVSDLETEKGDHPAHGAVNIGAAMVYAMQRAYQLGASLEAIHYLIDLILGRYGFEVKSNDDEVIGHA